MIDYIRVSAVTAVGRQEPYTPACRRHTCVMTVHDFLSLSEGQADTGVRGPRQIIVARRGPLARPTCFVGLIAVMTFMTSEQIN